MQVGIELGGHLGEIGGVEVPPREAGPQLGEQCGGLLASQAVKNRARDRVTLQGQHVERLPGILGRVEVG